jgi:adhesin/invasin
MTTAKTYHVETGESMGTQKTLRVWVVCVLTGLALVVAGCGSKHSNETTPSGTTVQVTASPNSINSGGTSIVEAIVMSGTTPLADRVVTFTASPSTAGYFTPSIDTTDASGAAATVYTATTTGPVTVTASVGGSTLSDNVALSVSSSGSTGSGNVSVAVSPSLLLANGSDTATVTVTVRDAVGTPAPDSTVVKIVAGEKFVDKDENGYWSNGIDSLVYDANANGNWDALGLIASNAIVTGGQGKVTVKYIAAPDAYTVYIHATVNDNGIVGFGEASLQLTPSTTVNSIYLTSDSLSLRVKATGGIETGLLRATGFDINGNRVPEGLTVNFVILDGPGGGEHLGAVGYGPYPAVTNSQGVASAPIHSGTVSGTIRVRAYLDTVLSNATQVLVASGPPQHIVVGAEKCNVPYWIVVAGENKVSAVVSDLYLNPVVDSTVVYFSCDEGTMKAYELRTQDHEGIATSKWISGTNVPTADGRVWIYAETAGGTVMDSSVFFNSSWTETLTAIGMPATMAADGASKVIILLSAADVNDNPVVDNTTFKSQSNYLTVGEGTFSDGCFGSSARVPITSTTLSYDGSRNLVSGNDDGIGAYDVVTFYNATASVSYTIALLTGGAYAGKSAVNGPTTAKQGETINISASIKDRWGNPLADHTLNLTASGGAISGGTQESDSYGDAYGFRWTAPTDSGDFNLNLHDTDPRGGIDLGLTVTVQ